MAQETNQTESQAAEKQTNCPACGKPIKKVKCYYRNNKYYCNKKCFRKATQKKKNKNRDED